MSTDTTSPLPRLVRRAKRLLIDIEGAGYVLSLVTSGGQPHAVLHPEDMSLEGCTNRNRNPEVHDLGPTGVGEMIAL